MPAVMTDAELARRCAERDRGAWDSFVREHLDLVYRAVRHTLRTFPEDDVEDVVQSVFLKLLEDGARRLQSFQGKSRLSTWLVVIARRTALDWLDRRRRAEALPARAILPPTDADPARCLENEEVRLRLRHAVDRLAPREALLLRLIYFDGASYEHAARLLNVPENSISPWILRAKKKLEQIVRQGGGMPSEDSNEVMG